MKIVTRLVKSSTLKSDIGSLKLEIVVKKIRFLLQNFKELLMVSIRMRSGLYSPAGFVKNS